MRPLALILTLLAAITLGALAPSAHAQPLPAHDSIPELNPAEQLSDAKPGVVYRALARCKAMDGIEQRTLDLRYTFCVPEGFSTEAPAPIVIVLHPDGVDYRWGSRQLPSGALAPSSGTPVVICMDGTSLAPDGTRTFRASPKDLLVMRDFVLEVSRTFPTARVTLVGFRAGGRFAMLFAGAFARILDGVISVSSGIDPSTPIGGAIQGLPLVIVHGTRDETTPYAVSLDAVHALVENQHPGAMLRRLPGVDALPAPARVSECVDWVAAMTTTEPPLALAAARALLLPHQGAGEASAPPAFHMARAILRRFESPPGQAPDAGSRVRGFKDPTDDARREAWGLSVAIEAQAQAHVDALKSAGLRKPADLDAPSAPPMLGHLHAFREDFRGVDSAEAYVGLLQYDERWSEHSQAAVEIWNLTLDERPAADLLQSLVDQLPKAWLYEALPPSLYGLSLSWREAGDPGKPSADLKARATALLDPYFRSIEAGEAAYRELWARFKVSSPGAPAGAPPAPR